MKPLTIKALGVVVGMTSLALQAANVEIRDQYASAVPAASGNSAAYLSITNRGKDDIQLLSADSKVANRVELHGHKHEGDIIKMFKLDNINLPAGKTEALTSGGSHIMLMGLKKPLKVGDQISVTLHFSDNSTVEVEVPVQGS